MRSEHEFASEREAVAFALGVEEAASFYGSCDVSVSPPRRGRKSWLVEVELHEPDEEEEAYYGRTPESW